MHAEATCRHEPIQKKKKRRSIFFCKFYSNIVYFSPRTLPHHFCLIKPSLSLPFASKNASRVLCLYLPLRAFLDLHIACEQALPGEWGWGRGREKGNESLHWRLINLNSTPRTPYGSSGVELSKSDQSDLPLFPPASPHPRESLLAC